jgi:hypothetical protein
MVRRATNYEPQGRESLSHKQQLALVEEDGVEARAPRAGNDKQRESVARKSRKSIYAHGAIDGAKARALVGKGWFTTDKVPSDVDSGLDHRLSDADARKALDSIYSIP